MTKARTPAKKAATRKAVNKTVRKESATEKPAAKRKEKIPSTSDKVDKWIEKMSSNKKYAGVAQVRRASEVQTPYFLRRPTGILGLDLAIGGGFPAGGSSEVHGVQSAGKTYLAYLTLAEHQRLYGEEASALIFGTEIRADKGFARKAGVVVGYSDQEIAEFDFIRRRDGLPTFTPDEIADLKRNVGNIVFQVAETADIGFDLVIEALKDDIFKLIIIESLGSLITKAMEEKDVGDRHVGGSAGIITNFLNKANPYFMIDQGGGKMLETTILGINQARAEIGGGPRAPATHAAAGAYAWKHGQLVSVGLNRGKAIRIGKEGPPAGKIVRWSLTKGKVGTYDGLSGEYDYYHVPRGDPVFLEDVGKTFMGVDTVTEAVLASVKMGVIDASGGWYTWKDEEKTILRAHGKEAFAEKIAESPHEYIDMLRHQCCRHCNIIARWT